MPRPLRSLLLACVLAAPLCVTLRAQTQSIPPLNDPANLAGERVSPPALADDLPINHSAAALEQLLRKLRTRASLMLIVAHPDDEDGGLLTFASRGQGARVAMLTLTRGEGGQNLMSGDFDDALGLIRTQELLAEDRYTGVEQMFGTEADFGFSKTREETLAKWTHDRVLYDAVRAVRLYRPLVLASVFLGGPTDGHGHHQVAGEITQEVFKAAADPSVFPEMLADGLLPWAPLKVYARVPFSRVTEAGMFDYATGKTIPPRFENYVTGAITTRPPVATVTIHEGDKPAIPAFHGMSFVQFARQGLALQQSQIGPNVRIPPPGIFDVGYTLMGSRLACSGQAAPDTPCPMREGDATSSIAPPNDLPASETSIFDGIDTSLPGIASLAPAVSAGVQADLIVIDRQIAEAQQLFDPDHVEATAPPLHQALLILDHLITGTEASNLSPDEQRNLLHELRIKRVQLNDALLLAMRITMPVFPRETPLHEDHALLTTQAVFGTTAQVDNGSNATLKVVETKLLLAPGTSGAVTATARLKPDETLPASGRYEGYVEANLPQGLPATRPYFTRRDIEQPFYDIALPALRNASATPAPVVVEVTLASDGVLLTKQAIVAHFAGPLSGQQLSVVPPVSVAISPRTGIVTPQERTVSIATHLEDNARNYPAQLRNLDSMGPAPASLRPLPLPQRASGTIALEAMGKWHITPARAEWQTTEVGTPLNQTFRATPDALSQTSGVTVKATASFQGSEFSESYHSVGYAGIPYTDSFVPARFKAVAVDVTTAPHLRIAYLPGTGDDVPAYLHALGVDAETLRIRDLTPAALAPYDEVVLGVRAYAAHPELAGAGSKALLDYARAGGVVVAQYNSGGFNPASAPYPYELPGDSAHNVVEEADPVTLVSPDASLLTWPNRITSADFDGWVAERGHGFPSTWAPQYQALLETHDPGQDPQQGGLLVAPVGRGAYIYCAFALYRQLPEAVPGAYRLFANLLSYARNPARAQASNADGPAAKNPALGATPPASH